MRGWSVRLAVVVCLVGALAVVGVSAADAPDTVASGSAAPPAVPTDDEQAPTNARPSDGNGTEAPSQRPERETVSSPTTVADAGDDVQADDGGRAAASDNGSGSRDDGGGQRRDAVAGPTAAGAGQQAGPARGAAGRARPQTPRAGDGGASAPQPGDTWRDAPAPDRATCPDGPRGAVVDRQWQRAWMCDGGQIVEVFPVTTARDQPDPGDYPIYEMDWQSFSDATPGGRAWLDRFVAFTHGKHEGLRIGFHAVPYYDDGTRLQPLGTVGAQHRFGDSDGCIRVLPRHAEMLWEDLEVDDVVRVLT